MALASREELKQFLSGQLLTDSDVTLDQHLKDGAEAVRSHSFLESHSRFAELQICYTAHLLDLGGHVKRAVAAESVDGISTSYASSSSDVGDPGETRFLKEYNRKKAQIKGLSGRVSI